MPNTKSNKTDINLLLVNPKNSDPYATNPGTNIQPVYKRVYDEGKKKFVVKKVDEIDIYEFIQASASSTDLAILRRQYEQTGEVPCDTTWMQDGEKITDLSNMPHNIHEVYEVYRSAGARFKALPENVRKAFKDTSDFMAHLVAGDANDVIKKYYKENVIPKVQDDPAPESEK